MEPVTVCRRCCLSLVAAIAFSAVAAHAAESLPNGIFLVARPELKDPNFRETVVLVTQPPGTGPLGVIINRPLPRRLGELFPEHDALQRSRDVVYFGGPVARNLLLFLVRTRSAPERAMHVLEDVYLSADNEALEALLRRPEPTRGLRVYAGYSGWGVGQLQIEIARGGWYVLKADVESIFSKNPATIWQELLKRATVRHTQHALDDARVFAP